MANKLDIMMTRGYATITLPDGNDKAWISRPTPGGVIVCNFSFSLRGLMPMIDALADLEYIDVDEVQDIDNDISSVRLLCLDKANQCASRLLEDLPEILDHYKK